MKTGKHEETVSFSKTLLIQESILIWLHTIAMLTLAYICVFRGYFGELPWLAVMAGLPWVAYAVSQKAYYKKAEAENTEGGIKYETVMADYITNVALFDSNAQG